MRGSNHMSSVKIHVFLYQISYETLLNQIDIYYLTNILMRCSGGSRLRRGPGSILLAQPASLP